MIFRRFSKFALILIAWLGSSCALLDDGAQKKPPPTGLVTTPVSYYSTPKARYLGTRYKENLERLAMRIVRDPKTASLQFANNISSVGGIGFFTHSATETPDERYLEVVLATPETFETKGNYSEKVARIFARYGPELLSMLGGDKEIYQDEELSGYGLNLAWRNAIAQGTASRIGMARAVIYFHKERVLKFLRQEINADDLLANAVIFAVEDDGPLQLVSYQPHPTKPDYRPPIREDNLAAGTFGSKLPQAGDSGGPVTATKPKAKRNIEDAKQDPTVVKEQIQSARTDKSNDPESRAAARVPPAASSDQKILQRPAESDAKTASPPLASRDDANSERLSLRRSTEPVSPPLPLATTPSVVALTAPTAAVKTENETKRNVPATTAASKNPVTSKNQISQNDREDKTRATESAIAAPKPAVVAESQKTSSAVAPSLIARSPISPAVAEKAVATPAAVANLQGHAVAIERPGAANLEATRPALPVEKAPPMPIPRLKPRASAPLTPALNRIPEEIERTDSLGRTKAPVPAATAKTTVERPAPEAAKFSRAEKTEMGAALRSAAKSPEPVSLRKPAKAPPAASVAKIEAASINPVVPGASAPVREKIVEKPAPERLASLKKPDEAMVAKKPLVRSAPKPLEGFIIQIAFNDKEKAQSWAEKMERRGYAVSVTEAGAEGSLRVRLGNFAVRDDAERQLKNLKQDGMKGIIINLPQAFRPEARSSLP